MLQQYQTIREIFFRLCAKLRWRKLYCCVVQMLGSEHARCFRWFRSGTVVFQLFKVFSLRLQHIWHTYRANIRNQLIENSAIMSVDKTVFHIQISDCYSMCWNKTVYCLHRGSWRAEEAQNPERNPILQNSPSAFLSPGPQPGSHSNQPVSNISDVMSVVTKWLNTDSQN